MRLIDADDLLEIIEKYCGDYDCHDSESFDKQAVRMAIRSAPTITPQNEWVSVDERLPETAGEYLVVYHPCHWDNVSAKVCVGIDSFRGKTAWAKKKYQRVTHWMPLPAPPEKENDGR